MSEARRFVWILLGLFTVLCAVLFWNFAFQWTSFFPSGTKPPTLIETSKPTRPALRATDPARGSTDPNAILIVEFADFTCQYCRAVEPEIETVIRENVSTVRHVWRDLPVVTDRPDAMVAASAGRCAMDQGRFWDMHAQLISYQGSFDLDSVEQLARTAGLDGESFRTCVTNGRHIAQIQQDIDEARVNNIQGAPTFFIGNEVLSGYVTAADLRWAILKTRLSGTK